MVKSQLPLRSAIIEILRLKNGMMLDNDLLIALKKDMEIIYFLTVKLAKHYLHWKLKD